MKMLLSKYKWHSHDNIHVTGFIRVKERYLRGNELAVFFSDIHTDAEFEHRLLTSGGQFAVIINRGDITWAATDRLRTVPLFYTYDNQQIIIGDSAIAVASEMSTKTIDEEAAEMFLATGYTLNNNTLIKNLYQVEAGEAVIFNNNIITRKFYHSYNDAAIADKHAEKYFSELEAIIGEVFKSHLSALKDRFIVIPLSGGYDSRLIAAMCKEYHPDNVLCYTYGSENNEEVAPAREVAGRLGMPWINIIYDPDLISGFTNDPVFKMYYPYASEFTSMFFMQEYFAVKYLKENKKIPDDAVFIPGHTGNVIAGEHIAPFMIRNSSENRMLKYIISEHFIMTDLKKKTKESYITAIRKTLKYNKPSPWLSYEEWELKERQAKFIVNSANVFTFFGYEYIIPLWDNSIIDFFNHLPAVFKINKRLYDSVLKKCFFSPCNINLETELNPTPLQTAVQRLKKPFKRFIPRSIVTLFINHSSPLLYDAIAENLIIEEGRENFSIPHLSNNYNSYLTQWYYYKISKSVRGKEKII